MKDKLKTNVEKLEAIKQITALNIKKKIPDDVKKTDKINLVSDSID